MAIKLLDRGLSDRKKGHSLPRRSNGRRRLSLQPLEARRLLAVFVVNTLTDSSGGFCGPDGVGNDACSLRAAIIAANQLPGADIISLSAGTYSLSIPPGQIPSEFEGDLDITDDLTINGSPNDASLTVIDAQQIDRVFSIDVVGERTIPINVTFNGLTIQGGLSPNGLPGGGIDADLNTNVTIIDSVVQNNRSDISANDFGDADAGGIATSGNLVLTRTTVRNNFAADFGGGIGIFDNGSLTITDSNFVANISGNSGGGIWVGNRAENQISITGTGFNNNQSTNGEGGGLHVEGDGLVSTVTLNQVSFLNNEAAFGGGGANISGVASLSVTGGNFDSNASEDAGGGLLVFDSGAVVVDGTTFIRNTAVTGGGGAAVYTSATFRNTLFEGNSNTGQPLQGVIRYDLGGGGIAAAQQSSIRPLLRIEDSSIRGNTAALAAGIGAANSFVEIVNSTVDGNQAIGNVGGGGGIGFAQDDVSGNAAARVRLTITSTTISNNVSGSEAGGIGIVDADTQIMDSTITGNTASAGRGGGIGLIGFANAPTMQLNRVTIDNNSAASDGGGIAAQDAGFSLLNTTLSNNSAGSFGGGLAYDASDPTLSGNVEFSTIATNTSQFGSNVAVSSSVTRFLSTIVADPQGGPPAFNFVSGGPGQLVSRGNNLISDNSSSFAAAGDQVNVDPLLGPLADNGGAIRTRALLAGSPAIDAGSATSLAVDARSVGRPIDGDGDAIAANDIGAFEAAQADVSVTAQDSSVSTPEDVAALIDLAALTIVTGSTLTPTFTITMPPSSGTVIINGGVARFDPAADLFTTPGTPITFEYSATVGSQSDTGTISIDVTPVNDPPVFVADPAVSATRGVETTITGTTMTNNDLPGPTNETEAVTILSVTAASDQGGTVALSNGDIAYTPPANTAITRDTITYLITDGSASATATLAINITEPAPPTVVANDSPLAVNEDFEATLDLLTLTTVSGSTTTPTFVITTQPARGTATITGTTLTYDPEGDDFTTTPLTLVYIASVGTASDTGTITIDIAAINDPPIFFSDAVVNAARDTPTTITGSTLTSNDLPGPSNETGIVTIASIFATSNRGSSAVLVGQNIIYTPPTDTSITSDTITYSLVDDEGQNTIAFVDIVLQGSTVPQIHRLSTGSGDGDVSIDVDSLGAFGTSVNNSSAAGALYDPIGTMGPSSTIFDSRVGLQLSSGLFEPLARTNPNAAIQVPISGSLLSANSQFMIGPYSVSLVQTVAPNLNSAGERLGAQLSQTYIITNTSGVSQDLNLIRYVDADLLFDGSISDGGGVLTDAAGNLVLFETDEGGIGSTDTTFVGIANAGGMTLTSNRFEIDQFSRLRSKVFSTSNTTLSDTIFNDSNADGFVDAGSEYDVELALASRFLIAPGSAATFTTKTLFGTRPTSVAPPSTATLSGQVACDANGNGTLEPNEASAGVTVFVDQNGNRLLDSGEPNTTTDSSGSYSFSGLNVVAGQTATVVVQNPPSCAALAPDIGVTRSLFSTGALSRGIVAADINNDGHQELLVVNELGNNVSVLVNNGSAGGFSQGSPIALGKRPVAISSWQPVRGSSAVVAVAAVGTSANRGSIYVIENGQVSRELSAGDGPVSVAVNDFNGDGQADFVVAALRSGTIVGRMSGETTERVLAQARSPKSITAAQLNDDNFVDLVVVEYGFDGDESSEVIVLLGDGRGNFTLQPQPISGSGSVDVAVANFDDDSADEIVVASYDGSIRIFDFNGQVLTSIASVSTQTGVESIAAGDVNQDGRTDLVIANSKQETIDLFINQTSGFVRNRTISGVPSPSDLVIANLDGDNILDIAVSNLYSAVSPTYTLPSSATVLGLTVTDRPVSFTANQSIQNFTFRGTPLTPQIAAAWAARSFDVDYSGNVSARDALVVINSLSRMNRGNGEGEGGARKAAYDLDVNRDGQVTALDALLVINHMSRVRRQAAASAEATASPTESEHSQRLRAVDALMADTGELF